MSISLPPTPTLAALGEIGYGHGLSVHPEARGQGLGWTLIEARRRVLADLGLSFFIGMTQPDNGPVLEFFRRQGLRCEGRVEIAYPDGAPGLIYMGCL